MIKALAIIAVRNEEIHIYRCLSDLISSGLDVILIDNESTDRTCDIASYFLGRGLLSIKTLPWKGAFSLSDILHAKQNIIASAYHDWIIHCDVDEWLCTPSPGQSLIEGIIEADASGSTCINFHEIVFIPMTGEDFYIDDYSSRMHTYYFFQPYYHRLNRAWKRTANLTNFESGGHILKGDSLKIFPRDFFLRHYIILSEEHALRKYGSRRYSEEGLKKGWHNNRVTIKPERLKVKKIPELKYLSDLQNPSYDLSNPLTKHFWDW
jgi:glycosyltransferase involved in cell wall biosynthesis